MAVYMREALSRSTFKISCFCFIYSQHITASFDRTNVHLSTLTPLWNLNDFMEQSWIIVYSHRKRRNAIEIESFT